MKKNEPGLWKCSWLFGRSGECTSPSIGLEINFHYYSLKFSHSPIVLCSLSPLTVSQYSYDHYVSVLIQWTWLKLKKTFLKQTILNATFNGIAQWQKMPILPYLKYRASWTGSTPRYEERCMFRHRWMMADYEKVGFTEEVICSGFGQFFRRFTGLWIFCVHGQCRFVPLIFIVEVEAAAVPIGAIMTCLCGPAEISFGTQFACP